MKLSVSMIISFLLDTPLFAERLAPRNAKFGRFFPKESLSSEIEIYSVKSKIDNQPSLVKRLECGRHFTSLLTDILLVLGVHSGFELSPNRR